MVWILFRSTKRSAIVTAIGAIGYDTLLILGGIILYKLKSSITFRIIDNNALIINTETGQATTLDETGTIFFNILNESGCMKNVVSHFKENYDVSDCIVEYDTSKFLKYMIDNDIFAHAVDKEEILWF